MFEATQIKDAIKSSKRKIVYEGLVAKKDNFEKVMSSKPRVIHISCHGIEDQKLEEKKSKRMGLKNLADPELEGHFLLFENDQGTGELFSAVELKQLLDKIDHEIELVVVAACQSEMVGKIFRKCGVRHVICVESKRKVLDEAAIKFTERFYEKLFRG